MNYKGTKWYKCDLHVHTTASKCFQDRTVTPEQWVDEAIAKNLNCIAVTDHNCGNLIDEIKAAAAGKELTVFPGVEITCDTSKVHLLILFDPSKTSDNVNDFIITCGITREMFADQAACSPQTIFDVASKADAAGAIVIPAHIDEYNGLGSISNQMLKDFYSLPYINAVQVVHSEFLEPSLRTNNNESLRDKLNDYYNQPTPPLDYTKLSDWHKPVKLAIEYGLSILTFSDNPHEPKNSKHGIAGIGTRHSWIKMDEQPSLEGLRQANLLPEFRIKNNFDSITSPYQVPSLWIKSICISNTSVTGCSDPLKIEFSPQLNTIIGGRGSGKSSILRFIRGVFNRTEELSVLPDILKDHSEFYKRYDSRSQKGVLYDTTEIEVEVYRNGILHKVKATNIQNSENQDISITKFDKESSVWSDEESVGYLEFLNFEHYSQKQIYEIAQEPNSLRERIDDSIESMDRLLGEREIIRKKYYEISASIRTIQQQVSNKAILKTEIKDLGHQIDAFKKSGIAEILSSNSDLKKEANSIAKFIEDLDDKEKQISEFIETFNLEDINYENWDESRKDEIEPIFEVTVKNFNDIQTELENIKTKLVNVKSDFESKIEKSEWLKLKELNDKEISDKKIELSEQGVDDISTFEQLSQKRDNKQKQLDEILELEKELEKESKEKEQLRADYLSKTEEITKERANFVMAVMQDDKVKVSIKPLRNKTDFEVKLRSLLERETSFETDIEKLSDICFTGNVKDKINDVKEIFAKIREGETPEEVSGHFVNLVKGMKEEQLDELDLLFPEDEIEIKYKPSGSSTFRPLSSASAGQKTTAILTLILSQGSKPLLLDQPEDDLDNRLVYELIVDRLKQAKNKRQILVVTHNANIPVNGDAEYIISMDSESKELKVLLEGTVENSDIKTEICDVMEGTEAAFDMRTKRYKMMK